ncbi:ABC transporter substrate-binding protein [Frankia nepalensis]|uniref:ABC transporter substrate-binding protein n=2 Tax=Frankia nepalensis TaxID=1836974 RepID=UPI0027DC99E4|nr:ABC transporter substrate-binding protein [Frankia nepalensis]
MAAVAALALTATACGGDSDSGTDGGAGGTTGTPGAALSLLGPSNPASGEPVKVGFISDGKTPAFDNTIQIDVANAMTKFLNEHEAGIGGRPIELVVCETAADPGKAGDCAPQFIQADVAIVVAGESTAMDAVWRPMHDAGIPIFLYATTEQSVVLDRDSTFAMGDPTVGLGTMPINVAKDNNVPKVTVVGVDVPVVTGFYDALGQQVFSEAGLELKVVAIPPGQADMTPQMAQIAGDGPTEVHIIGNDSFCIAAFNGLEAAGFDGPISVVNQCVSEASRTALGDILEGVYVLAPFAIGDEKNPDLLQYRAIVETYGKNDIDLSKSMGDTIYVTMMALHRALDGFTGEVTPAALIEKIRTAPALPFPAAPGLTFQCNGAANPLVPAVCNSGALLTTLDAQGNPTLPYKPFGHDG